MLAHEIKNPLSGIRGAAQLLEQQASSEDRMLTRLICDEADRIVTLVDRMEVFGDDRPVARGPVNIHSVLDHVKRLAQSGFARNVRFIEDYDPSLPSVLANQDQLIQVFLNLVKNAAEAVVDLGTDAEIQLTTAFRPGVRLSVPGKKTRVSLPLEFCVKDNGSGVPEDLLPNLFDPFVTTKTDRQRAGPRPGRQDRRRSRRDHRMRVAAAQDHLPRADAYVQRCQTLRSNQSRRRCRDAVARSGRSQMRDDNACW